MAKKKIALRKRRTREHVLEDLSIHHVEGFALHEGHTIQRADRDYGYDLFMFTFDDRGYAERGLVFLQVKAAEALQHVGADYVFDLDVRDYNLWIREEVPVILILFDAARQRAFWLAVQRYFREKSARRPRKGRKRFACPEIADVGPGSRRGVSGIQARSSGRVRVVMTRTEVPYGQLDRVLRALGFTRRFVAKDPPTVRYEHPESGALISLPPFDGDNKVIDHHLAVARATLETFGIADPFAFAAELQKAG